ncbi:hypothetical protein CVT26_009255 [Gymnopilus dilepis]|uniref:DUF6532 domain-containing protein n=1 Tax=Gymnopilus dilepis TaxID=231916 RepID=A0A409YA97_9AGAR|nr:hypothetical protein CVT26_009255 [Gymnopilus dilepis]
MADKRKRNESGSDSEVEVEERRTSERLHKRSASKKKKKGITQGKNNTDEEELRRLQEMKKQVAQFEAKLATRRSQAAAEDIDDDESESEEELEGVNLTSGSIQFLPSIRVSGDASNASKPAPKFTRVGSAAPKVPPRIKVNLLKTREPSNNREPTPEEITDQDPPTDDTSPSNAPPGPPPQFRASPITTQTHTKSTRAASSSGTPAVSNLAQPLANPAEDELAKVPLIRSGVVHNPKDPKASDFEDTAKALILRACFEYECRISTRDAFPSTAERRKWAAKCWKNACADLEELYSISDTIKLLMYQRGSRIRGRGIDKIKQRVEVIFVYSPYLHAVIHVLGQDYEARTGYAQGRLVFESLQTIWFEKKSSHGVVFGKKFFNPISLRTIALIFAIADFILERWSTGTYVAANMYETEVRERYYQFESHLQQWHDVKPEVVDKMLTTLYNRAYRDAGATEESSTNSTPDNNELARMREELEGRTGETESEEEGGSDESEDEENTEGELMA